MIEHVSTIHTITALGLDVPTHSHGNLFFGYTWHYTHGKTTKFCTELLLINMSIGVSSIQSLNNK